MEIKCGGSRFIELNPYKSILEVAAAVFVVCYRNTPKDGEKFEKRWIIRSFLIFNKKFVIIYM